MVDRQWQSIVNQCQRLFRKIDRSFTETLKSKISVGKLLLKITSNAAYGSGAVKKLSEELSVLLGYKIHPARLYEYMKVAKIFDSPDDVFEAAGTRDLTWIDVLRLCGIKRQGRLIITITLDNQDKDILKYKNLPYSQRNEFLKESLKLGLKTLEKIKKLPDIVATPRVVVFNK